MSDSQPGFFVQGISRARILEWVASSSCKGSFLPRDWTRISCIGRWILYHCTPWEAPDTINVSVCSVALATSDSLWPREPQPARLPCPWDFPSKNTGVGFHALLQEIFLTQGLNPSLLHLLNFRHILDHLNHQGRPEQLLTSLNIIPGPKHGQNKRYSLGNLFKDIRSVPFSIHLLMLKIRQKFSCNLFIYSFISAIVWMFMFPQHSCVKVLNLKLMVLEDGRCWVMKAESSWVGFSALIKEGLSTMWGHDEKVLSMQKAGLHQTQNLLALWSWTLQPLEL